MDCEQTLDLLEAERPLGVHITIDSWLCENLNYLGLTRQDILFLFKYPERVQIDRLMCLGDLKL